MKTQFAAIGIAVLLALFGNWTSSEDRPEAQRPGQHERRDDRRDPAGAATSVPPGYAVADGSAYGVGVGSLPGRGHSGDAGASLDDALVLVPTLPWGSDPGGTPPGLPAWELPVPAEPVPAEPVPSEPVLTDPVLTEPVLSAPGAVEPGPVVPAPVLDPVTGEPVPAPADGAPAPEPLPSQGPPVPDGADTPAAPELGSSTGAPVLAGPGVEDPFTQGLLVGDPAAPAVPHAAPATATAPGDVPVSLGMVAVFLLWSSKGRRRPTRRTACARLSPPSS